MKEIDPRVTYFAAMLRDIGIARVQENLPPGWESQHRDGLYIFRLRDPAIHRPIGGVLCIQPGRELASMVTFVAGVLPNIVTLQPGEYRL